MMKASKSVNNSKTPLNLTEGQKMINGIESNGAPENER